MNAPKPNKRQVTVNRDDLIDAIGSLELRVMDSRQWADEWAAEGDEERALDRRQQAEHYEAVIQRFRQALESQR